MDWREQLAVLLGLSGIIVSFTSSPAFSEPLVFSGELKTIVDDQGGGIFSGASVGTKFYFETDSVSGLGSISDGTTVTPANAIFENGRLFEIINNDTLAADVAALINSVAGTSLVEGDLIDLIETTSEVLTPGGGELHFQVTYHLDSSALDDQDPNNYPPDPEDVLATLFFIVERDSAEVAFHEAIGVVDFDSLRAPLCDTQLNQATFFNGETVAADTFRFANLTGAPVAAELKLWLGLPGLAPISAVNAGADGSFVFPAGADNDSGPIPLFTVTATLPRGGYEFSCRMLDPITGKLLWEDLNNFEIQ